MLTLRPKLPKCIDAYEYSSGNAATVRNVEAKGLSLRSTILPASTLQRSLQICESSYNHFCVQIRVGVMWGRVYAMREVHAVRVA